jgi:hypothetical protein
VTSSAVGAATERCGFAVDAHFGTGRKVSWLGGPGFVVSLLREWSHRHAQRCLLVPHVGRSRLLKAPFGSAERRDRLVCVTTRPAHVASLGRNLRY